MKTSKSTVAQFLQIGERTTEEFKDFLNWDSITLLSKANESDIDRLNKLERLSEDRLQSLARLAGLDEHKARSALRYFYNWQSVQHGGGLKLIKHPNGRFEARIDESGR